MSGYRGIIRNPRLMLLYIVGLWISVLVQQTVCSNDEQATSTPALPTVTVRGFLNFKTTVDGTVIVFTPVSEEQTIGIAKTTTKPPKSEEHTIATNNNVIYGDGLESREAISVNNIQDLSFTEPASAPSSLNPDIEDFVHHNQKGKQSFLPHISDNAVLPSTVQTDNDVETDIVKKSSSHNHYPTGLVTVLNGTHVEDGKTTIFETRVVGTYIDGKYAQILQSTSKIIAPTTSPPASNIIADSSVTTPMVSVITSEHRSTVLDNESVSSAESNIFLSAVNELTSQSTTTSTTTKFIVSSSTNNNDVKQSSTMVLQSSFASPEVTPTPTTTKPTQSLKSAKTFSKYKSSFEFRQSTTTQRFDIDDTTLLSSKNLRTSSSRIRFTAPRKPSQRVRLNRFKVRLTLRQNSTDGYELTPRPEEDDLEDEEHSKQDDELNTELPMDMVDQAKIIYRPTTITSLVTLHVGRKKSIRTLTITTSVPKIVNPTDFDGIAMTHITHDVEEDHEAQDNIPATATQSVVTRTYTTTERTHTTSIVPVFDGTSTTSHTLTESFFIMKIITAYRTLPPGDVTILHATDTDDEYLPIETPAATLEVAANVQASITQLPLDHPATDTMTTMTEIMEESSAPTPAIVTQNLKKDYTNKDYTNPMLSFGQALSNNPLAAVYLGLQQLNAQVTLYSTMTHTSTYITTDTIYSTKTVRFYDGKTTRSRLTSEPIVTTKRTITTTITSVQPYINTQAYQQQQQLQQLIVPTQQHHPLFSTLTSIYTTSTTATSLSTRIYTLIYNGFSTKFRTVTSTKLYPTLLTITATTEVPLTPTQPPMLPFAYPFPAA